MTRSKLRRVAAVAGVAVMGLGLASNPASANIDSAAAQANPDVLVSTAQWSGADGRVSCEALLGGGFGVTYRCEHRGNSQEKGVSDPDIMHRSCVEVAANEEPPIVLIQLGCTARMGLPVGEGVAAVTFGSGDNELDANNEPRARFCNTSTTNQGSAGTLVYQSIVTNRTFAIPVDVFFTGSQTHSEATLIGEARSTGDPTFRAEFRGSIITNDPDQAFACKQPETPGVFEGTINVFAEP